MKVKPRLFKARRRGPDLFVGREPLPSVRAWIEQNRPRLGPGFHEVQVWHDHDCRMPRGGPCTCKSPSVRLKGDNPDAN